MRKRSFGWIARKIHNKINYLKVPTYVHHQEDRQCQMNDAEIMTTALIAALCFRGNHESARAMLKQYGYVTHMVSKSRFSRRLHRIKGLFIILFNL
jgi:hypothetical protein